MPDNITQAQEAQAFETLKKQLTDKKSLFVIIPIGIIILVLLFMSFFWFKNNFIDGRKTDIKESFTSITYNVPYELQIIKSDKNRIEITKNDNPYGDEISFDIKNNDLKITNIPKISIPKNRAQTVILYTSSLAKITNNNKANISVDSIYADEIELNTNEKGNITVDKIQSKRLITTSKDSGDIIIKEGKTDYIEASIVNSSGKINLSGVEAPTAKTKDIGTGTIKLNSNTKDQTENKDKKK
jgi:hypothetical protein